MNNTTHPLISAIEEIRNNPKPQENKSSRLDDVPMKPMPTRQRQQLIRQYMNTSNQVALINLIRLQVRAEEYWGNRND
jgi:hypothetical protein